MKKKYEQSLFIFRRDLRVNDNRGLRQALTQTEKVIPCFIFDPQQVGSSNEYKSQNAIQFMIESLKDLEKQLKAKKGKLYLFHGDTQKIISKLIKNYAPEAIFLNRDYTPFSIKRDKQIQALCNKNSIELYSFDDALLNPPEAIKTKNGDQYSIYTPFFKASRVLKVDKPKSVRHTNFYTSTIKEAESTTIYKKILKTENEQIWVHGGTTHAKKLLNKIKTQKNYKKTRDFPALETTNLSAHNKFGTVSIRELYHKIVSTLGKAHPLIAQLYWRDFFYHVAYYSPFVFGQPYREKYKKLSWNRSKKNFQRWCDGQTGFPIVDAGMRQLNATGYMHNRARMIVASFLTKDLHINWLWGEKYFAQKLVDYDPCVNNGSWQWVASTGTDAQPYFRIFNPWLQQKKFDPDCTYIKEWVPELKNVDPKIIHNLNSPKSPAIDGYPQPIVDHKKESALSKELYKRAGR